MADAPALPALPPLKGLPTPTAQQPPLCHPPHNRQRPALPLAGRPRPASASSQLAWIYTGPFFLAFTACRVGRGSAGDGPDGERHQAAVAEARRHLGGGGKRGWLA